MLNKTGFENIDEKNAILTMFISNSKVSSCFEKNIQNVKI